MYSLGFLKCKITKVLLPTNRETHQVEIPYRARANPPSQKLCTFIHFSSLLLSILAFFSTFGVIPKFILFAQRLRYYISKNMENSKESERKGKKEKKRRKQVEHENWRSWLPRFWFRWYSTACRRYIISSFRLDATRIFSFYFIFLFFLPSDIVPNRSSLWL